MSRGERHYYPHMDHMYQDRVSLALARHVAEGLDDHPEWIGLARANLTRWAARNAGAPMLLRCYSEWTAILDQGVASVRASLLRPDDEGQRLRQNSPFAGVMTAREVWALKERLRNDPRAA